MVKKSTVKSASDVETAPESAVESIDAPKEDIAAQQAEIEKKAQEDARKKLLETQQVNIGDWVYVDLFGKTVETEIQKSVVFQASNEEDAKLLLNYDPKKKEQYTPDLAIIGKKGFLQDKVDEIIQGMHFFESKTVQLEPKDAFGDRDAKKLEKINAKQFVKDMNGEEPRPGSTYRDKKGRTGVVLRANQGRLIVDFNHPLAGRKIEYHIKVIDKIEGFDNRVKALIGRRLGGVVAIANMCKIQLDTTLKTAEIEVPAFLDFQLAQQQGGAYFKMGVAMEIQENLPEVDTVKFVEIFPRTPTPNTTTDLEHDHEHVHEHDAESEKKEE